MLMMLFLLVAYGETTPSVILNIREDAKQLENQLHHQTIATIGQLHAHLQANLEKARSLLEQALQKGDLDTATAFEHQITQTMKVLSQDLNQVLGAQAGLEQSLANLQKSITEGAVFFEEQGVRFARKCHTVERAIAEWEGQLRELAARHARAIERGDIDPSLDALAVRLESQLETARLRLANNGKARTRFQECGRQYRAYLERAQFMQGHCEATFDSARYQLEMLADLAEARAVDTLAISISQAVGEFDRTVTQIADTHAHLSS